MKITESKLRKIIREEITLKFLKEDSFNEYESKSLSSQDVGNILGVINQNIEKLVKNAEDEQMPDIAQQIRDSGDQFLDFVKDSGMMATQAYSKKNLFAKQKKFTK